MKLKFPSILSCALLLANVSSAEVPVVAKVVPKITVGVKLGGSFVKLTDFGIFDGAFHTGFLGGGFVGLKTDHIGVQAEGLFSSCRLVYLTQHTPPGYSAPETAITWNASIPVLFEFKVIPRLWVQIGPQISYLLLAKDNNSHDIKDTFHPGELAGVVGLQVLLPARLTLSARYIYGFTDLNNSCTTNNQDDVPWYYRSVQLSLGYGFR